MRTAGLVAAAGLSTRMGAFKPMLALGEETLLRHGLRTLLQAGAHPVIVVTGRQAKLLEHSLSDLPVQCLYNPRYAQCQMFDSVKLGLAALEGQCDQVLFSPGDAPAYSAETVSALLAHSGQLCCPVCGGKRGHPVLLPGQLIPQLLAYEGPGGLAGAMEHCGGAVLVETGDRGILLDADTPEDYRALLDYKAQRNHPCAPST